jgi:hypothetical protein
MNAFDPYLSSQPLAEALRNAPQGRVIMGDQYYTFSSVFFYADLKDALLWNGRYQNLEYGSYAPGAPNVFVDDSQLSELWRSHERAYLIVEGPKVPMAEQTAGKENLHLVKASGGKFLFTNQPLPSGAM